MRFERDLEVRLRRRYARLYKSDHDVYGDSAGYLRDFIAATPALRSIVDAAVHDAGVDPAAWCDEHWGRHRLPAYKWPPTEEGQAAVTWWLLNRWADGEDARHLAHDITGEGNFNDALRAFTEKTVEPLVDFLEERLGTESEVLYLLERFARRVELFERDDLFAAYESDTARGEALYDRHLQRFLFDQGVDKPIAKARSASGEADVLAELEGDDPLVCELKLFDGHRYGPAHLARGVHQAVEYALDWGKTVAHLVIVNVGASCRLNCRATTTRRSGHQGCESAA